MIYNKQIIIFSIKNICLYSFNYYKMLLILSLLELKKNEIILIKLAVIIKYFNIKDEIDALNVF